MGRGETGDGAKVGLTWHMCLTANVGATSDIFAYKSVVTVCRFVLPKINSTRWRDILIWGLWENRASK